jgi:hypothetical protein
MTLVVVVVEVGVVMVWWCSWRMIGLLRCTAGSKKCCLSGVFGLGLLRCLLTENEFTCFDERWKLGKKWKQSLEYTELGVEAPNKLMHPYHTSDGASNNWPVVGGGGRSHWSTSHPERGCAVRTKGARHDSICCQ